MMRFLILLWALISFYPVSAYPQAHDLRAPLVMNFPTGGVSVVANTPLHGFYVTGGGALVSMCPGYNFGCDTAINKIMAQATEVTTSLGDASVQESAHYAYMVNQTGQALPWATNTAYTAGQVSIAASGANLYKENTASCTSASSGTGPTGTGANISDGSCNWNYVGNPSLRGKIASAATILTLPGGSQSWAGADDNFIEPGWSEAFAAGREIDITNNSGRDATGSGLTISDLYLGGSVGTQPITSYIDVSPFGLNGTNIMAHEGIWMKGQYTIADHNVRFSTHSLASIFDDGDAVHATSSYYDASTAPHSYIAAGHYSIAAFDTSIAVTGVAFAAGEGQLICFGVSASCLYHSGTKLFYQQNGVNLFSVEDGTGNAIFKGTVTQSSTP